MPKQSQDEHAVERARLIDRAPDDVRWIHPDVKITTASFHWRDLNNVKEWENYY